LVVLAFWAAALLQLLVAGIPAKLVAFMAAVVLALFPLVVRAALALLAL
jgi:hypothetical protein